jgi:predicted hydrocarbon binding protein
MYELKIKDSTEIYESHKKTMRELTNLPMLSDEDGKSVFFQNQRFVSFGIDYFPRDVLDGLKFIVGDAAGGLFRTAARGIGRDGYRRHLKSAGDKKGALRYSAAAQTFLGWGIIDVEDLGDGEGRVIVYNSFEAESYLSRGETIQCYFIQGIWWGIWSEYTGERCEVEEIRCASRGDEYCEIILKVK